MKKLLITGFDPFGGESVNPSWEAVKLLPDQIGGYEIHKLQIPTVFGLAPKTVLEKDNVRTIGIDTWGVDYALIDQYGRMLANPTHYRDTRTEGIAEYVNQFLPLDELYARAGIQQLNFNTIFQLAADRRDDPMIFDRAERLLNIPDLLNYFLTGKMANEYTILSTGALLDANARQYAFDMMEKLGIPQKLFGEIVQPGYNLGKLLPQVLPIERQRPQ